MQADSSPGRRPAPAAVEPAQEIKRCGQQHQNVEEKGDIPDPAGTQLRHSIKVRGVLSGKKQKSQHCCTPGPGEGKNGALRQIPKDRNQQQKYSPNRRSGQPVRSCQPWTRLVQTASGTDHALAAGLAHGITWGGQVDQKAGGIQDQDQCEAPPEPPVPNQYRQPE